MGPAFGRLVFADAAWPGVSHDESHATCDTSSLESSFKAGDRLSGEPTQPGLCAVGDDKVALSGGFGARFLGLIKQSGVCA